MSINKLWLGNSPLVAGASSLQPNAELIVREGYFVGETFEFASPGRVYIDNITHQLNQGVAIRASSELKKLANNTLGTAVNYDSSFLFASTCDEDNINENWQQANSTFSVGGSIIIGASSATQEVLVYSGKGKFRNFFAQARMSANVDGGLMYIGGRMGNIVTVNANNQSSGVYTFMNFSGNQLVQREIVGTSFGTLQGVSFNFAANTSYWLRFVGIDNRFYSLVSTNGYDFVWPGATPGSSLFDRQAGSIFLGNQNLTATIDDIQFFSYDKVRDINSAIRDLTYKSSINNIHIPARYASDFTTGLTNLRGSWGSSSNGVLTGIGTSINSVGSRRYASYYTGASFQDFNFSVEINIGSSTFAGIMFGLSGDQFNAFTLPGISINAGESNFVLLPGLNEHIGVSSYRVNFPVLFDYPYVNTWTKLGVVKNDDRINFLVNDLVVYAYRGRSAFNLDNNNVLGVVVGDPQNSGVTPVAMFRNLRVESLSNVLNDFELTETSTASTGLDRLRDISDFNYIMSGLTMRVITELDSLEPPVKTIGISALNWDNTINLPDGLINHVVVYGDNISADAWDDVLYNKLGKVERLRVINDKSLTTYADCLTTAQKILDNQTKQVFSYSMEQKAYVDLELFDVITVRDREMGISQNLRIDNFTKRMSIGEFTQRIDFNNP